MGELSHRTGVDGTPFFRTAGSVADQREGTLLAALLGLLLVTGFFLGPVKLLGISWLGYLGADLLASAILLLLVAQRLFRHKPLLAASPLTVPLVLLGAVCILELANPGAPFVRSVLGLRSWLLYTCFYFVGLYSPVTVKSLKKLYGLLVTLAVLTALYGVYQWKAGPQHFSTWSDYYSDYAMRMAWLSKRAGGVFRAFSTYVMPGTFGENMALVMLLAISVAASKIMHWGWRLAALAAFAIMGVGIAASGSRAPVAHLGIALAVGILVTRGVRGRLSLLGLGLTAVLAVVVILAIIAPVVSERFRTLFDPQTFFWKWFGPLRRGIGIAVDHPFGMGMGYTAGIPRFISNPALQDLPTTNIDSGYGSAAAELGLIGLAGFMYLSIKVGIEGLRTWRSLPAGPLRTLLLGPGLYAGTFPIVSIGFQPQAALPSSIYFWLLIGILIRAPELQRQVDENRLLRPHLYARQ